MIEIEVEGGPLRFISKAMGLNWQQEEADMGRLRLHRMNTWPTDWASIQLFRELGRS